MKLCLGTVQFGQDYGIQGGRQPQQEYVNTMLSYAIQKGIYEFDTAAAYGDAEKVLGIFIRNTPDLARKMHVVSKLHPDAFAKGKELDWPRIAVSSAKGTLERLGLTHLSAYHFHRAHYLWSRRAVKALYAVKEEGLADVIGVATYTPEEAMKALELDEIEAIQIPYNVFDRRLDQCGFFKKAADKGLRVYARSSLLQGLALMDPDQLPANVTFARKYMKRFHEICDEYGISALQAAIAYVQKNKEINYLVFGVDNLSQLKEYIGFEGTSISEEMMNCLDMAFMNVEERLVNPVMWR